MRGPSNLLTRRVQTSSSKRIFGTAASYEKLTCHRFRIRGYITDSEVLCQCAFCSYKRRETRSSGRRPRRKPGSVLHPHFVRPRPSLHTWWPFWSGSSCLSTRTSLAALRYSVCIWDIVYCLLLTMHTAGKNEEYRELWRADGGVREIALIKYQTVDC